MVVTGRRTIGNEGRTPEDMATGGNKGERTRHQEVGKLVSITQIAFRDGYISEALTWMAMILIPKVGGGYRFIGSVEVICNVCALIVNNLL